MKHPPAEAAELQRASGKLGVRLAADRAMLGLAFEDLLRDRAMSLGLIARSDAPRLRERHILDCLRAASVAEGASTALDLGSGAGLPGILVAIALPELRIGLIESRRARVSFLEFTVEALGLTNVRVIARRAETLDERVDLCFARAFAPLPEAWRQASRLLAPGGRLVYFEGERSETGEIPLDARLLERRTSPVLESAGALVIMAQQ